MSQTRPEWTNLGESDTTISGNVIIPNGVKVYYYSLVSASVFSFVGDGTTTLSGKFEDYDNRRFVFIASCGDDIAMFFNGDSVEEG